MRSSYSPLVVLLATLFLTISQLPYKTWGANPPSPVDADGAEETAPNVSKPPPPLLAIPGPLEPFLRLAAVSRKATPEEVLPLLSHQVVLDGYGGSSRPHRPPST